MFPEVIVQTFPDYFELELSPSGGMSQYGSDIFFEAFVESCFGASAVSSTVPAGVLIGLHLFVTV